MLALFAILLLPAGGSMPPAQSRALELERLVLCCDRIVRASVTAVHDVPAKEPTRLLELKVEEVFWGEPDQKVVFVLDNEHYLALHDHGVPAVGDDSIWFLERDPSAAFIQAPTRDRIAALAGGQEHLVVGIWGRARLPIEKPEKEPLICLLHENWVIPDSLPIVARHSTKKPERDWDQVRELDLERWLRSAVAASIPSIEAIWSWTAPAAQPIITIDKQGHARRLDSYLGDKQVELGPEGLGSALLAAERERFFELPCRIGNSLAPESNSFLLRIRTEKGGRQIRLCGPADPKQDSPADLEAHARAMRVWNAIPLVREWKIDGH